MNAIIPARRIQLAVETIRVGMPLDAIENGAVRIVSDDSGVRVLEFRCSCGKTTLVECEYNQNS